MNTSRLVLSGMQGKLSPLVRQYVKASLSENTLRAYADDLRHFIKWGGKIPATPAIVASYLADHADKLSMATLCRRAVAIGKAHTVKRLPSPTQTELVKATLRGMRRVYGSAQRRVRPILPADLHRLIATMKGLRGARDRALLLVGFTGAFRRSELVSLCVEGVTYESKGIVIRLRRGKTDQDGKGREVAIPYVRGRICPVKALKSWLDKSGIESGAIFRRVTSHGVVLEEGITAQSVALIIKARVAAAGLNADDYSGHSLRAGLVTSAALRGVEAWRICRQTGHQSETVMHRYIRNTEKFADNPVKNLW